VRKTHISPRIQKITGKKKNTGTQKNTGICRKYRNGESNVIEPGRTVIQQPGQQP